MKARTKSLCALAAIAALCLMSLYSCQVAQVVIAGTTFYETEIITVDNRIITGQIGGQRSSNLPSGSKTISIKTADGRQKIKSENIKYMKLSRKNLPEKQQTLVYTEYKIPYTKKGEQKFRTYKNWQILNSVGDNLLVTAYGHTYSLAKDGTLIITYSTDTGIQYCLQRKVDDCPIHFGRNTAGRSFMRKQWQKYLADDPVLCEKIKNKEIDAFDFKAITEQYNPQGK
ncbi:MAG: hypothetical protein NC344_10440 [Bacteroidales bacterium]|nr:hypothetical protein [Bacteroidales bacterium]MCM1148222.1 hypothetical protein [Bacteroidales bacterium]MCM1206947.1 hypothetical protein [Bacillota bacterium]MCM1511201.1 hypothetical protein [Clostridium sp.]